MAMLASKSQYVAPMANSGPPSSHYPASVSSRRHQPPTSNPHHTNFASPTESEFSDIHVGPDSVKSWDEERVGDWLKSINLPQYEELFKANNITGEVLMEMDSNHLKEMGIRKIGDRIRISSQAKLFRNREYKRTSKRNTNRDSLALLDSAQFTPPSSGSPRPLHPTRAATTSRPDKRISRQTTLGDWTYNPAESNKKPSRPGSPLVPQDNRNLHPAYSPKHPGKKDQESYFTQPLSATSSSSRGARSATTPVETPQTARFVNHVRASPSVDNTTNSSILPADKPLIRVIFDNGRSSVIGIEGCRTAEDIMLKTLRKGALNEAHVKNYCFYVLDGTDPNPALCRRLSDVELLRVCNDRTRMERARLILRKVHAGEPEDDQLKAAANISTQQQSYQHNVILPSNNRSQLKIEKLTGESLAAVSYPLSPASQKERERHINSTAKDLERTDSEVSTGSTPARRMKQYYGGRPPSNLIASDLASYFPDVEKGEIDKTMRMSIRRSRRISKAASRLSTLSSFSVASSLKDAPPLPSIADQWLGNGSQAKPLRPLSVMRLGLPSGGLAPTAYRDSVTSSVLEPLEEESPTDSSSIRKSYVSFGPDSGSDTLAVTDPEGNTTLQSYFDDGGSSFAGSSQGTENGDSFNKRLSQAMADDGEEYDEELEQYLETDSWENVKYMKGALIGQGSFGSVYLALHAITGELMAVKQVGLPTGGVADSRKTSMLDALKREIGLLRELKHPNIVQYLGSNSDETHLNIFLEYVPGGSVATMLVNYGPLMETLAANFTRQILVGLAYLHSMDIIHRDIKGANILVDNKGQVKISDFGISKRVEASTLLSGTGGKNKNRVSLQGSVFWMAPEVVKQTAYTRKADIWSLGCLIVEMLTGVHPHADCTQLQAIFRIGAAGGNASPTIPDNASKEASDFLGRTFEIDHEKRPTAEELLSTDFVVNVKT
ncbi:uncharacterized protein K452DRAFT_228667 [Aplosporella prunicola CBS 121167]|uniref:mitogen-activated protein kinase kinase kinase n=1 Tax=Aplosporella prunicola CBS 121167 TaxID=1176127 RepID=A0A6A6BDB9_9PEZI|nr:uncharacterized protein K452DRAFT_228667 [Aplosporella prunicola CBS 121167]KAF2141373.1 hypothetical protein K452DRAFT_228667 [Aplosporella prunicola CBS 121167]